MLLEALAALIVGLAGLWLVLQPILAPGRRTISPLQPLDPEETPRGIALAALKEIDFDRETGKLSEVDYQFLKTKYTEAALEALRNETGLTTSNGVDRMIAAKVRVLRDDASPYPRCASCGVRPEADAVFCSTCGLRLTSATTVEPTAAPARIPVNPRQAS